MKPVRESMPGQGIELLKTDQILVLNDRQWIINGDLKTGIAVSRDASA